jgi:glucosamine 6-phosphate synthetase-like amidotransferase/phosphosugar isomerase protein
VVVHLLEAEYDGDLVQALARVYPQLEGHFTNVAIHHRQPDLLVGVRHQTPLVVGLGEGENFLASNVAAFLSETRRAVFPDDGEIVEITPAGARFYRDGAEIEHPEVEELDWDDEAAEKGGYETFMLKEIYEQPEAVRETIGDRVRGHQLMLEEGTPVVVVATNIHTYEKIVSNIQETRARGAHVIAIATDGNEDIQHHADDVIFVPRTPAFLQAGLAVIPLQLLAYRIARLRGLNVDQPRNLAKTVTVE